MSEFDRHAVVAQIHDTEVQLVLAVTGGGVASAADLLAVPGASRTVLEVIIPYAEQSLAELLGGQPEQAVSVATARAMAAACQRRAVVLAGPKAPVAGVACTAALVTDRAKRGEHRAHVAVAYGGTIASWSLTLAKGERDRVGEDRVVSDLVLRAIATTAGVGALEPL